MKIKIHKKIIFKDYVGRTSEFRVIAYTGTFFKKILAEGTNETLKGALFIVANKLGDKFDYFKGL